MSAFDEPLIPLVDEPIGMIMNRLLAENPEIEELVKTPRRILAFRTFAYIRLGIVLGELLLENDVPPDGDETWVDAFLQEAPHRTAMVDEMRSLAAEIALDPAFANDDEPIGPDSAARDRFREFARQQTLS